MASGAMIARILTQYSDKGSKQATRDIKKLGGDFDKFARRAKVAFGVAAAASAAFAIKVGVDSVKAAMEDQKSQALLANSLRNTVDASDAAIAAVERHISKQQLLIGVTDEQLRPSLASLTQSTHDVGKAQELLNLALDIAANKNKDLAGVSLALAKANQGSFTSLKKLGIPLSENLIKTKDFTGIMKELAAATAGAATTAANTFAGRMDRMKIGIDEAKESLGYAFLPVLEKMVGLLVSDVIPKIQAWVDLNKDKLARGLQTAANFVFKLTQKAVAFGDWISNNTAKVKAIALIFGSLFVGAKVAAFITAISALSTAFATLRATAAGAAVATAFATGGASVAGAVAAITIAGLGAAWLLAGNEAETAGKKITYAGGGRGANAALQSAKIIAQSAKAGAGIAKQGNAHLAALQKTFKVQKDINKVVVDTTKTTAKATAEELATAKGIAALKALGITGKVDESDPIQLEAARQNLIKQSLILRDAETAKQLNALTAQINLTGAAQKYNDILSVIKDNKITDTEVQNLATKWGVSAAVVRAYITQVTGVAAIDFKGFTSPGDSAATGWGNALTALNAYFLAMKSGSTVVIPKLVVPKPTDNGVALSNGATLFNDGSVYNEQDRGGGFGATPYVAPFAGAGTNRGNGPDARYDQKNATVNVNLNGYDPQGATALVQTAVQQVLRNGGALAGSSSRIYEV